MEEILRGRARVTAPLFFSTSVSRHGQAAMIRIAVAAEAFAAVADTMPLGSVAVEVCG